MVKKRRSRKRSNRKTTYRRESKKTIKSYYKGHYFEDAVKRYFELLGYKVRKNVRIRGFSGAMHEIDVLLEMGDEKAVVEVKNFKKPVAKEWVMKAHNVAEDIGADKTFVVSSSGFTRGAMKVAKILGVELLDLDEMVKTVETEKTVKSIDKYFIRPAYGRNKALEYSYKFVVKRFFKRVEEPIRASLIYVPFYMFSGKYRYYEEEGVLFKKVVERYRGITILVDAVKGRLVYSDLDQPVVELVKIPRLTDNEIDLLKIISEYDEVSWSDLLEDTGWSRQKLSRILKSLRNKEVIDYDEETRSYYSVFPSTDELDESTDMVISDNDMRKQVKIKNAEIMNPKISINMVKPAIEKLLDAEFKDIKIIYIPIYKVVLQKIDGSSYRDIYLLASLDEPILVENF